MELKIDFKGAPKFSRKETVVPALQFLYSSCNDPLIVEIGCIRERDDLGAGNSSELFAWVITKYGGKFYSCDNNERNINLAKSVIKKYKNGNNIKFFVDDGIHFLTNFDESINLLYLDSMDAKPEDFDAAAEHHFQLFKAYEDKLDVNSFVLIDDIYDPETYAGKGAKLIPYLMDNDDYECLLKGYQFLFVRRAE